MRDLLLLAIHLFVILAKFLSPGSARAIAAESLPLKHQLLIGNRSRQRAPNLSTVDRVVVGLITLFVSPHRIRKLSVIIKSATLFKFHKALVDRKCRRLVGFGVERTHIDCISVCRMFNCAIAGQPLPKHASTDHDPLFCFHRWLAKLRVLEIDEIKSVPYVPVSHPFIERLIGTVRREYLDRVFIWNCVNLTRKLGAFRDYYNEFRVHRSLDGTTPTQRTGGSSPPPISLDHHAWRQYCGGLFQAPIAA